MAADYDPFGEANVVVQLIESNFRFPGQYFDEETGLHQNWHRDYAPGIGRYVEPDPLRVARRSLMRNRLPIRRLYNRFRSKGLGPENYYVYASNSPARLIDPRGLWTIGIGGTAIAGAGGAVTGSFYMAFDGEGNIGLLASAGGGGMGGISASCGGLVQGTDAGTIYDLEGPSTQTGGSYRGVGGELVIGDQYMGGNFTYSPQGVQIYLTPGEEHSVVEEAWVLASLNWKDISEWIMWPWELGQDMGEALVQGDQGCPEE